MDADKIVEWLVDSQRQLQRQQTEALRQLTSEFREQQKQLVRELKDGTGLIGPTNEEEEEAAGPARLPIRLTKLGAEDDAEAFLVTFERVATAARWPQEHWATILAPYLSGPAQLAYRSLSDRDSLCYYKVKEAILDQLGISPETYRQRFRAARYATGERPRAVAQRIREAGFRWLEPSTKTATQVADLVVLEQYLQVLPAEGQQWVRRHLPGTLEEAVTLMEHFLAAETPEGHGKCGQEGHIRRDCPMMDCTYGQPRPRKGPRQEVSRARMIRRIRLNGEVVEAVLDSGCGQTLVRRDALGRLGHTGAQVWIKCVHGDTRPYPTTRVRLHDGIRHHAVRVTRCSSHIPEADGRDLRGPPRLRHSIHRTWEEHLQQLGAVLRTLQRAGLSANPKKCQFGKREVSYLGYTVGRGRLKPLLDKVCAIRDYPRPHTKRQVRQFLGLAGYYRRFIKHFASLAAPLTDLTKKEKPQRVVWTPQGVRAFEALRQCLVSGPVLRSPDFEKPFLLQTDASEVGLGAVLAQEEEGAEYPVAYLSRKLFPRERNYAVIEKEALAIKWAIDSLRYFLTGNTFTLVTDHAPLKWMQSMKDNNARIMRWYLSLQPFRFDIKHRPGYIRLPDLEPRKNCLPRSD
nr:uncharacterized protein LOC112547106 [Pelodiscus sinensis]|eukprot:XP_025044422.1 uncharacterized protein LOC112547106 [Pelodiscus sinensis]